MIRHLLVGLGLIGASVAWAAEPVLVPDFTPGSSSEFALAFMLQEQVVAALENRGYLVLLAEHVHPVVGDALQDCADRTECPANVLSKLPTRLALVVKVARIDGQVMALVKIFEPSSAIPAFEKAFPIHPGGEAALAEEVKVAVEDVVGLIGKAPPATVAAAAALMAGQPAPGPAPAPGPRPLPVPEVQPEPVPEPEPEPAPKPKPKGPVKKAEKDYAADPLPTLLEGTGLHPRHLKGSEGHFRKLAIDARDWQFKAMPHAGRLILEIRGGVGIGDVDRFADVRVVVDDGAQSGDWFQEGPQVATRVNGAVFVGYAPYTFFDVGAVVGLQYGLRNFTTGYIVREGGVETERSASEPQGVQAVQLLIQPRIRFYPVPVGPAKPFLFVGAELRALDKYDIDQPQTLTYPAPPGGMYGGPVGGGGLMIDPGPIVGFFAEASVAGHFGIRSIAAQPSSWVEEPPPPPAFRHYTISVVGGVQFRL